MTPSHIAALERVREKVVEAAKIIRALWEANRAALDGKGNWPTNEEHKAGEMAFKGGVDALLALESQTCEECGGAGIIVDRGTSDGAGEVHGLRKCPMCDHGRKRTEGER